MPPPSRATANEFADARFLSRFHHLPNFISLSRILLGGALLFVYSARDVRGYLLSLGLIGVALVSDVADGFLARRLRLASRTGYVIDGLGDRAVVLAIILALLSEHCLNLIVAWLFVMREVGIYALRTLHKDWYEAARGLRRFSRLYAATIRLWLLSYLMADGCRLFTRFDPYHNDIFSVTQAALTILAFTVSYYPLYLLAFSAPQFAPPTG